MTELLRDPALIVGLVRAALILAISFGVAVTQDQVDSILLFVGALLAVISIVLTQVTRLNTTPSAGPSLKQGTSVEVITPEGQPNFTTVL